MRNMKLTLYVYLYTTNSSAFFMQIYQYLQYFVDYLSVCDWPILHMNQLPQKKWTKVYLKNQYFW